MGHRLLLVELVVLVLLAILLSVQVQLEAPLPLQLYLHAVFLYSAEFRPVMELPERGAKSRGVGGEHVGYYGLSGIVFDRRL